MTKKAQLVPAYKPGTPKKATFTPAWKVDAATTPTVAALAPTTIGATSHRPRFTYTA